MKRLLKAATILTVLTLVLVLCSTVLTNPVYAATYGDLTYSIKNDQVTITGCNRYVSGELTVPDAIDGYPVKSIGAAAFNECDNLTSVILPKGVTNIGRSAFQNCDNLSSVLLCDGVISIEDGAFNGCDSLTLMTIPDSVTSIGSNAFRYCTSLTSVTIPDSVTDIGSSAFEYCGNLTTVTIGNGVTSIGNSAFEYCGKLTTVTIGSGVTDIGIDAFDYCRNLTNVYITDIAAWCGIDFQSNTSNPTYYSRGLYLNKEYVSELIIPGTIESISDYAFAYCVALKKVTISEGVRNVGFQSFYCCNNLTEISIPGSMISIDQDAFAMCLSLNSIQLQNGSESFWTDSYGVLYDYNRTKLIYAPAGLSDGYTVQNGVKVIANNAFVGCNKLTSLYLPESIETIGMQAFSGCTELAYHLYENALYLGSVDDPYLVLVSAANTDITSCNIHENTRIIYQQAFDGCNSMVSVSIPNKVISIGANAFTNCNSLTDVHITDITSWCSIEFAYANSNPLYFADHLYLNNEIITELVIPDGTTNIGSYAFYGLADLTSVTIADSVTDMGDDVFNGCKNLTSVTIGNRVDHIGARAFFGCASLASVTIPDSVRYIDIVAFRDCTSLTSVIIGNGVTSIGSTAFNNCKSLTSVVIPNSVITIDQYAFSSCSNLTSVTIPDSVTSIGAYAFEYCNNLSSVYITDITSWCNIDFTYDSSNPLCCGGNLYLNGKLVTELTIPNNVTSIGDHAFVNCTSLTSVTIGNGVTGIGVGAFSGCENLTSVKIPESVTSIGASAFYECTGLTSLIIPDSVTIIDNAAFRDCDGLTSVSIGNGTTVIGKQAFYNCEKLTSVSIGKRVAVIGEEAFASCYCLSSIKIPDSVTDIESNAFSSCGTLTSLTIGNGVTSIGDEAFYPCGIDSITIPASVKNIGPKAFRGCLSVYVDPNNEHFSHTDDGVLFNKNKTTLISMPRNYSGKYSIPNTVRCIEEYAFSECVDLTSVMIPDSVTGIGDHAFDCCTKLTSVTIPDSVTSIGGNAFNNCDGLTSVTIGNSVSSIGEKAFYSCDNLTSVTIPDGVSRIENETLYGCVSLTVVTIPDSVTGIGYQTFYGCHSLVDVCYTGTQEQWDLIAVEFGNNQLSNATLHSSYVSTVIEKQPVGRYAVAGSDAKFTVTASGKNLTYQWQYRTSSTETWKNAASTGNKTATLTVPASTERNGYQYRCQITNSFGMRSYTNTVKLTVFGVKTSPVNQNIPTGKTVKFTVKATGSGLKYQWQYRASSKGSWKNTIATGFKTATLSVAATAARNGYQYRCKITDKYGNVIYSNAATLKIVTLKVTTQPANKYLPAGKTAKFTVKASGSGLKYQWQYRTSSKGSWKNSSGTGNKTTTLSVSATAARNGYQYRCKITDKYGNVIYSNAATLKIVTLKITTQPSSVTLAMGKTATFKVVAKGTGLKYQWQYRKNAKGAWKKATNTGNKTATLKVPVTAVKNGYQYRCVITDKYGNVVNSSAATLKVK